MKRARFSEEQAFVYLGSEARPLVEFDFQTVEFVFKLTNLHRNSSRLRESSFDTQSLQHRQTFTNRR
jgi:hypothetical protein